MSPSLHAVLRYAILFFTVSVYSHPMAHKRASAQEACAQVQSLSGDDGIPVFFPESTQYNFDISHWSNASSLPAACTVEPDTVEEVQSLMAVINSTRTPWAVKSGGHCNNQNMSSTLGLQIAMNQFRDVTISPDRQTVRLGMGLRWGEVYAALDGEGVIVVGGRDFNVGVGGLALSSGYSWLTNEYGFAIDNIVSYDIVLPDGTFAEVTETSDPQLFRALQGGVNNFGIVTHITMKTHPIGEVFGGVVTVSGDLAASIETTVEYANITSDPKATLAALYGAINGSASLTLIMFYDGPEPPEGLFDPFLNLPNATVDVETRSFLEFVESTRGETSPTNRGTWYSAPILSWPKELVDFIVEELTAYSIRLAEETKTGSFVSGNVEPFLPQAYSFSRDGAWPHDPSMPFNTFNGLFLWEDPEEDDVIRNLTVEYHTAVWNKAIELGVSREEAFFPPNYSQIDTPVSQIYGDNLPWLQEVQRRVDPYGLVALTGGFKI